MFQSFKSCFKRSEIVELIYGKNEAESSENSKLEEWILAWALPMRGAFCSTQLSLHPHGESMNLCGGHFFSVEPLRSLGESWSIS